MTRTPKPVRRAMCDRCGTVRPYTGNLGFPHLACPPCGSWGRNGAG